MRINYTYLNLGIILKNGIYKTSKNTKKDTSLALISDYNCGTHRDNNYFPPKNDGYTPMRDSIAWQTAPWLKSSINSY